MDSNPNISDLPRTIVDVRGYQIPVIDLGDLLEVLYPGWSAREWVGDFDFDSSEIFLTDWCKKNSVHYHLVPKADFSLASAAEAALAGGYGAALVELI